MSLPALLVLTAALAPADLPWQYAEAASRTLVRLHLPAESCARPVAIKLAAPLAVAYRAWDLGRHGELPVQVEGDLLWIDLGPAEPGQERRLHLYPVAAVSGAAVATLGSQGQVETSRYRATLNLQAGGVIDSLQLKEGARRVETLGRGVHWWVGRQPSITQESRGPVRLELLGAGPVFTAVRLTHTELLGAGSALTTTIRFFRDFLEVDHRLDVTQPTALPWFKLPVTLRATGQTPGVYSHAGGVEQPVLTVGKQNRWVPSPWVDVSYAGEEPFGLGVINRTASTTGGLYFMDSVRAEESEWIYAEPVAADKSTTLNRALEVNLTVVPHPAGAGSYRETLARLKSAVQAELSAPQAQGTPAPDTDGDALADLAELDTGSNPTVADTDLDGLPDGRDPQPLRGPAPPRQLALPHFTAAPTSQRQTLARVSPIGGVPTLTIDGQAHGPMCYTRCAEPVDLLAEKGRRGFKVLFEMVGSIGWPGEQQAVFQRLDRQLGEVLQQVPDARLILRLYVCNPPGFASRLPAEVMRFDDGDARHFTTWYAMKDRPVEERGYPSFASEIWRRNTAEALREYVTHVRQSSYAANVIGYFVCGGGTEEWYYWGDYDHQRYALDFSPPMLRAFREDLRRFYAGDVQRLRAAWNSPAVDFASALPPDPEARRTPTSGPFWDPAHSQREIDYYYTHNKAMEDSLLIFARAIKQASNREHLVGMFHGYLQNHWLLDGGQAQLRELLASDDIDFWSGPPQYDRRGPGEHGCVRFLMRSLQRHGKLWISEADIRTSFVEPNPTNPALHGRPTDLAESLACLQREFAHQLCEGGNGWWFPMGKGWYHQPPILELFGQMQRVGQAAMACDRRPATDIAAVVDLDSLAAAPPFGLTPYLIDAFKVQELCRLGAPVDHWELDDLLQEGAPQYKLYLMLNPIRLTAARRQRIDQHLRRHGATLVWFYAPGLIDPERSPALSLSHSRDLLGLTLTADSATDPLMRLTTTGARLFPGFDPARSFGKFERPRWGLDQATGQVALQPADDLRLKQRFVATGAEPLATFDDGATAMAMRRGANATDLWIGGLMAPADLLRGLARHLGCHLYCDADEIIYANRSFLAIHTRAAGERTFQLRQPADVTEVFSGQVLGRGVSSFRDTIGAYRTRLYHLGDAAAWQPAQGG